MESLAKQAHTEELSKLVKCLSQTRANLGQIGELLKDVETRIDEVEKKVGLDDDDCDMFPPTKKLQLVYLNILIDSLHKDH